MRFAIAALLVAGLVATMAAQESPALTGELGLDVARIKMNTAARALENGDTGSATRRAQTEAIDVLSLLIQRAEQREKKRESTAAAQGAGQSQSADSTTPSRNPGSQSGQTGGGSRGADTVAAQPLSRIGPQSPWSTLREKERDPVYNAIQEKFPARYRQLIEQYYKSFQDGANR